MKRKSIKIITTTLLLSSVFTFTSLAGWTQTDAGWRYKEDAKNTYLSKCWIESETEKGLWYYLDENGLMATDKLIDDLYYVNELGEWREGSSASSGGSNTSNATSGDSLFDRAKEAGKGQVGDNNGLLMDPEIVQGIGEGLIR